MNDSQFKVACYYTVKNDADVLEQSMRHACGIYDAVFVTDHMSTDGTPKILEALMKEGLPITVKKSNAVEFDQSKFSTDAVRALGQTFDWVFLGDADELLGADRQLLDTVLTVADERPIWMKMETWAAIDTSYFRHENPLFELFRHRTPDIMDYGKVAIPKKHAQSVCVAPGNHYLMDREGVEWAEGYETVPVQIVVNHVPFRSRSQVICKAARWDTVWGVQRCYKWGGQKLRENGLMPHLRKRRFAVDSEFLQSVALTYMTNEKTQATGVDPDSRITGEDNIIRYPELAMINKDEMLMEEIWNWASKCNRLLDGMGWAPTNVRGISR